MKKLFFTSILLLSLFLSAGAIDENIVPGKYPIGKKLPCPGALNAFYEVTGYREENSVVVLHYCPTGLLFNSKIEECDLPENIPGITMNHWK